MTSISRDDLVSIGKYLYGERWQTPLADALGIGSRNVRGWLEGRWGISEGVASDIISLVAARQLEGALPIIADMVKRTDGIVPVELKVYSDDSNVTSAQKRPWSNAIDRLIKERMAEVLTGEGIPVTVVEVR